MRCSCSRATVVVLAGVLAASALAATRAYFVEPKAATSAWSPYYGNVGQSFIANVDSLLYVEWFVGDLSQPGQYKFEIWGAPDHMDTRIVECSMKPEVRFGYREEAAADLLT